MIGAPAGSVLLVGGVGLWPGLFEALAGRITAVVPDVGVVRHVRVGYDGRPPANDFDELVDDVRQAIAAAPAPVTLFGELGGATIALGLALDPPPGLAGVVAHEPLVGRFEPELHEIITAAATRLTDGGDPAAALEFVEQLIGADAWLALPAEARRFARDHASTIIAEVPFFAGWTPEDLRPRLPFMTTVGSASPPGRQRVARMLRHAGARTDITAGGHLASVDDPIAIVDAIRWAHAA
jgi:hypothetical protein